MNAVATITKPSQTALGALLWGRPLLAAVSADLKKRTITLELPPDAVVKGGRYVLLEDAEARAALAADAALVVFAGAAAPNDFRVLECFGDVAIEVFSDGYCFAAYYQRGLDPESRYPIRPGTWWGSEEMTDASGRTWSRSLGRLVMDDFGFLVEVPR